MRKKWSQKGKQILGYIMALCLLVGCVMFSSTEVYADNVIIAFSSSSVKIGEKLTVRITLPAGVSATVNLTYSTELFEYSSASDTANVNAGTVSMTLGSYGADNKRATGTVTFKAKSAGTGGFAVSAPTAGNQEGDQVTVGGASANVTVKNETSSSEKKKSPDNTLSELTISEGKLSPEFQSDVKEYTAEVENDVTSVVVSARPNHKGASVEPVNGGENLKVGENKIEIVVKAENGVTASYYITVTRKGDEQAEDEAAVIQPDTEEEVQPQTQLQEDGADLIADATERQEIQRLKRQNRMLLFAFLIVVLILLIVIVILVRKRQDDSDDIEESEDMDEIEEEVVRAEKRAPKKRAPEKKTPQQEDSISDLLGDFDLEDIEPEEEPEEKPKKHKHGKKADEEPGDDSEDIEFIDLD